MPYYVHEFRVRMVVENVSDPKEAERWLDVRLNGGDASFEIVHAGAIKTLSSAEAEVFNETGRLP